MLTALIKPHYVLACKQRLSTWAVGKRKADEPGENGHYNTTERGQVAFILQQRIQKERRKTRLMALCPGLPR